MLHTGRLWHWDKHSGFLNFLVSGKEKSCMTLTTGVSVMEHFYYSVIAVKNNNSVSPWKDFEANEIFESKEVSLL